jgi:hypothetical protein
MLAFSVPMSRASANSFRASLMPASSSSRYRRKFALLARSWYTLMCSLRGLKLAAVTLTYKTINAERATKLHTSGKPPRRRGERNRATTDSGGIKENAPNEPNAPNARNVSNVPNVLTVTTRTDAQRCTSTGTNVPATYHASRRTAGGGENTPNIPNEPTDRLREAHLLIPTK